MAKPVIYTVNRATLPGKLLGHQRDLTLKIRGINFEPAATVQMFGNGAWRATEVVSREGATLIEVRVPNFNTSGGAYFQQGGVQVDNPTPGDVATLRGLPRIDIDLNYESAVAAPVPF